MLFQTTSLGLCLLPLQFLQILSNGQESGDGSQILISRMNLTRRQYYQRINRLMSLGLINRKKGRYSLSSFGRILYETQKTIETAIQNRWRLVALDSLESSFSAEGMPAENKIKIINHLTRRSMTRSRIYFYTRTATAVISQNEHFFEFKYHQFVLS